MTTHMALLGEKGAGKSTLISRLAKGSVGGFRTFLLSEEGGIRTFAMAPYGSREEGRIIGVSDGKHRKGFPEVFDTYGVSLLDPKGKDLIVMDEIGVMEEGAEAFRKAVLSCLDGDVPVLLALKDRPDSPLIRSVLEHENVAVYEVTEDNREGLYEILREARSRE